MTRCSLSACAIAVLGFKVSRSGDLIHVRDKLRNTNIEPLTGSKIVTTATGCHRIGFTVYDSLIRPLLSRASDPYVVLTFDRSQKCTAGKPLLDFCRERLARDGPIHPSVRTVYDLSHI